VLLLVCVAVAIALGLGTGHAKTHRPPPPARSATPVPAVRPPAVEAGRAPWRLTTPRSREVVVPRVGSSGLVLLGGLETGGSSTDGVELLDTRNGVSSPEPSLAQATHDAAGAALGRRVLVIGGGSAVPVAATQIEAAAGTVFGGPLSQARADATAATIGHTVYVVGGYDGSALEAEVIATTDGRSYRPVVALPVPVRYPALAVLGSRIYVFGGLRANGNPSGVVQLVQPGTRTARVVGRLPVPLDGAAAGVLGDTIYLAGGRTAAGATDAVYAFEPRRASFLRAGRLRVAVANAGSAVSGGRLWLVGGEAADGVPLADVQTVAPKRASAR
jgi:N-acetylneuraminic acid mutarotase